MGAKATSALAIAVVPYGLDRKVEGTLHQMLAGALRTLRAAGCALIGGHTCEGAELSLGAHPLSFCATHTSQPKILGDHASEGVELSVIRGHSLSLCIV